MNDRKIARVARAICDAAGRTIQPQCVMCENGECTMWQQFASEAVAAIKAMKGF